MNAEAKAAYSWQTVEDERISSECKRFQKLSNAFNERKHAAHLNPKCAKMKPRDMRANERTGDSRDDDEKMRALADRALARKMLSIEDGERPSQPPSTPQSDSHCLF